MGKIKSFFITLLFLATALSAAHSSTIREKVQHTYTAEIGTRELSGKNDGKRVEMYLASIGLGKGFSWCAAFVSWTYQKNGVKHPLSAWAPSFFPKKNIIYSAGKELSQPQTGDLFGIYYPNKKRIAHVGFIDRWTDKYAITVEGNTNEAGSREGDGVYRKKRIKRQIYQVSRFIN